MMQPLVLTPRPIKNEHFLGYLLRVSEENGYASPAEILRYAGINSLRMQSIRMPFEKLIPILNRDPEELKAASFVIDEMKPRSMKCKVANQIIHSNYIQKKNARFCPLCVAEKGFIESYWGLRFAIGCPTHERFAISVCPQCDKKITWQRKGLLTCLCGFDLSTIKGSPIEDPKMLGILGMLRTKYSGVDPLCDTVLPSKQAPSLIPLPNLDLSLILSLINTLGNYVSSVSEGNSEQGALETVANALADWPVGFHSYLKSIKNDEHFHPKKQHAKLRNLFFQPWSDSHEFTLMRDEFISFDLQDGNDAAIASRPLNASDHASSIIGPTGLARIIGVQPSEIRNLVKHGYLHPTMIANGNASSLAFEITDDLPRKTNHRCYARKEAAKMIGVPSNFLEKLREKGIYTLRHIPDNLCSYHELDIKALSNALLRLPTPRHPKPYCPEEHITLSELLKRKNIWGHKHFTYEFFIGLLKEIFCSSGRLSNIPGELYFNKHKIRLLTIEHYASIDFTYGIKYTAEVLDTNPECVYRLIKFGMLKCKTTKGPRRITHDSLWKFSRQYLFLDSIAQSLNWTTRSLLHMARAAHAQLLLVPINKKGSTNRWFIPKDELHKLFPTGYIHIHNTPSTSFHTALIQLKKTMHQGQDPIQLRKEV